MSQIKQSLNVLQNLGITRWRLRKPLAQMNENTTGEDGVGIARETVKGQPMLTTHSIESNGELNIEPLSEPVAQLRNNDFDTYQDPLESHKESVSQEPLEAKNVSNTHVDSTPEDAITNESAPSQPSKMAQTSEALQINQTPVSSLLEDSQPDSALNVDSHEGPSWSSLASAFEQRTHCVESGGLTSLPPASQREAACAIILPAPSAYDIDHQQAHSESSSRLLGEILRTLGINPADTYQTNAIKCAGSALNEEPCAEWVHVELELLAAGLCIVFGESAARAVLKTNSSMDALRKAPQSHPFLPVQCIVTHSLEELLAKPELKQDSWQDLKSAASLLQSH